MPDSQSPAPTPDSRQREIFLDALEQSTADQRAAYLDRACGTDRALRQAVEALLENHKPDAFLETPAVDAPRMARGPTGTMLVGAGNEHPGDRIGRYRLLQEIGEGACGTVYMAEQEVPVRRRVALKIIKLGMDSKSVIARFEAERQALALMDHPNIAKVLDAGTTETGRPFFVMELVRGIRITEYCDTNRLATRERLDLFIKVCHAIQHAHQKGIIHRDIKPSNILVTLHDGVPVPKVIDFGIAKAIEQRLTDKTVFTHFEAFIGTPAYTSPEQAEMSGLDIDTRSDIYSLGVLFYELLTGETPFDPQQLFESGLDEMRRIIREEEPVRPSTRLSTMGVAEATALSRTRHSPLPALVQAIRGDLDWIVMKCLEKDRTRRYATANDLALDIQRYQDDEPVWARPPSTAYRLGKFVRRNRVMVTASAAMTLVLLAAVVLSTWLAVRARRAELEQSRLHQAAEFALQNEADQRQRADRARVATLRRAYTSDMNLVQQALAANNYGRVMDLLDRHRPGAAAQGVDGPTWDAAPDFRQWEWRYFWSQARSGASFHLVQQAHPISAIVLSPNGRLMVTGDRSGTIKLWDLGTRREVAVIREQGFGPSSFAFSRDGTRLALALNQGPHRAVIRIWTVATRQVTSELRQDSGVDLVAFGPNETQLFSLGQDMVIRAWNLESEQLVRQTSTPPLEGRPGPGLFRRPGRQEAAFSPDAKWLATAHGGRIRVVDVQTGEIRSTMDAFDGDVASLAFSPDNEMLAAGPAFTGTSTRIKLFATATGNELSERAGHVSWIPGLVFTPDGKQLISAGADQTLRIWNLEQPGQSSSLRGHLSEVYAVAVTPDGKTVVSGCKDGTLFGWDLEHLEQREPFSTLPLPVSSVMFFPKGQSLLTINDDRTVSLWNARTLRETERISALGSSVSRILLSPDGARVYAGTGQGDLRVLDWATRLVITNVALGSGAGRRGPGKPGGGGPGAQSGPIALFNDGASLLVVAPGGNIRVLDTASWEIKAEWNLGESFGFFSPHLVVSPDQRHVVVAGWGAVEYRNLLTGDVEATLPAQTWGVSGLALSPAGTLLATSSADGTVNLWDAAERRLLDVLRGHLLGVNSVTFSPDGQRLATISHGNEAVKLWDVETRNEVATLAGQGSMFQSVTFSPDGTLLVAINFQRTAYLWRAPSREEIAVQEQQSAHQSSAMQ